MALRASGQIGLCPVTSIWRQPAIRHDSARLAALRLLGWLVGTADLTTDLGAGEAPTREAVLHELRTRASSRRLAVPPGTEHEEPMPPKLSPGKGARQAEKLQIFGSLPAYCWNCWRNRGETCETMLQNAKPFRRLSWLESLPRLV